ncbi:MAG: biotin transporter BioY [Simkaniaceae bacterium]|nr:biotin transporter BioY [Simkaniaceae bacterium]
MITLALTQRTPLTQVLLVVLGSCIMAMASWISIPLPFTMIPFTLGPQAPMLLAILMGPRLAFASVLLFLIEGACGLPVFALGGSGLPVLLGPRGGYLLSYLFSTLIVGHLYGTSFSKRLIPLLLAILTTYIFGAIQLSFFTGISQAIALGVIPFILADVLKCTALATFRMHPR